MNESGAWRLTLTALALAGGLAAKGFGAPPAFDYIPVEAEFMASELCFPSGLRVTLIQDSRQPVVSVTSVVGRGRLDDPAGREGLAHLVEHLWFRSRPDDGETVDARLRALGAKRNAFTYDEVTVFRTRAPKDALRSLLALEAARIVDPLAGVDQAGLVEERGAVRSELREGRTRAYQTVGEVLGERLYPPGDPSRVVSGTEAALDATTLEDARALAGEAYRPWNITLTVTGDLDRSRTAQLVQDALPADLMWVAQDGSRPKQGDCSPRRQVSDEAPTLTPTPGLGQLERPWEQPVLVFGWGLPGGWPGEAVPNVAAAAVEGRVRAELGTVERDLEPSCWVVPRTRSSLLSCWVPLAPGQDAERLLGRVMKRIPWIWAELGPEQQDDLARSVFQEQGRLLRALDERHAVTPEATRSERYNHLRGSPAFFQETSESILAFGPDAYFDFVKRWLQPKDVVAVRIGAGPSQVVTSQLLTGPPDPPEPWTDQVPFKVAQPRLRGLEEQTLANGLRVVTLRGGRVPVIRVGLVSPGGLRADVLPDGDPVLWRMLHLGLGQLRGHWYSASRIAGTFGLWADGRRHRIVASGGSGNLDELLYLVRHAAEESGWVPDKEARITLAQALEEDLAREPRARAARARLDALAPGHPVGRSWHAAVLGGARDVPTRDLNKRFSSLWSPQGSTLYLVGEFNIADLRTALQQRFGELGGKPPVPAEPVPSPAPPQPSVVFLEDSSRSQTQVVLSCLVDVDGPAQAELLQGVLQRMLRHELRESAIGAYSPWARIQRWPAGVARLDLHAEVPPGAAGATIRVLRDRLAWLATDGVPDSWLGPVQGAAVRGWPARFVGSAQALETLIAFDGDLAAVRGHADALVAVDGAALGGALASCAGHEAISVVGLRKGVSASLEGAGVSYSEQP